MHTCHAYMFTQINRCTNHIEDNDKDQLKARDQLTRTNETWFKRSMDTYQKKMLIIWPQFSVKLTVKGFPLLVAELQTFSAIQKIYFSLYFIPRISSTKFCIVKWVQTKLRKSAQICLKLPKIKQFFTLKSAAGVQTGVKNLRKGSFFSLIAWVENAWVEIA